MNAPLIHPVISVSRERTAREHADTALIWHADLMAELDNDRTAEDFERSGRAALMSADNMAEHAKEEQDPAARAMFYSVAGRYALRARVCAARAKELRNP